LSKIADILHDIGTCLRPDIIVGRRYRFATKWNGEPLYVEGLVKQFLWDVSGNLYYVAKETNKIPVKVFGVFKERGSWRLQVHINHAVLILHGQFELI